MPAGRSYVGNVDIGIKVVQGEYFAVKWDFLQGIFLRWGCSRDGIDSAEIGSLF